MYFTLRQISVLLTLATTVYGSVTSISGTFEILSPIPNSIYVAGQILPIIYAFSSSIAATQSLQLAVALSPNPANTLNVTSLVITPAADVSQTGKLSRGKNNLTYYEHAVNFPIPKDTPAGVYDIIFTDKLQATNTAITVKINPEAQGTDPNEWFVPNAGGNNSVNGKSAAQPSNFLATNDGHHTMPCLCAIFGAMLMSLLAF
ncbi:hypothetical protein BGW37DRAFT_530757 [Umbelopsis sp. PMI_123]|nr:hypothetical protein BGW37DRAFT_530757 [Umbelopsis sp. PMI_123]